MHKLKFRDKFGDSLDLSCCSDNTTESIKHHHLNCCKFNLASQFLLRNIGIINSNLLSVNELYLLLSSNSNLANNINTISNMLLTTQHSMIFWFYCHRHRYLLYCYIFQMFLRANLCLVFMNPFDKKIEIFKEIILNIFSNYSLWKTIICNDKDPPWLTDRIYKNIYKSFSKIINANLCLIV